MTILTNRSGLAVVFSLVALVGCGGSSKGAKSAADESSRGEGHAEVGKPAPDLSIQTLNGKGKVSLDSLQGKVVVVDFWATWCAPCKASFPKLEELSKKVGDKVEIVGISVDDEKDGVVEFAKENGATFAIGWDEGHAIANRWKLGTMPTTFIVDRKGVVRHVHDGYHEGETKVMEKEVTALLDVSSSSDTRVARRESESEPPKSEPAADAKSDGASDAKLDAKTEATASAASDEPKEKEAAAPPPAPKKKPAGKKEGHKGGKAPAKKQAKKKK